MAGSSSATTPAATRRPRPRPIGAAASPSSITATNAVVPPVEADRAAAAVCLDWAIRSSDDADFGDETRVTTQSSNPYILFSGSFIGDYTGTAVDAAGHAVTVWTDFRGNPGITTPDQDTLVGTGY